MTDNKKNSPEEKKTEEKAPHIQVNKSFFSLPDRDKRILLSEMLQFSAAQLAFMEGVTKPENKD